jgi:two-component system CheB/CheR fusion protein
MPVVEVEQGMRLKPDSVFVMPPGVHMTTSDNHLHLKASSKPRGWPISLSLFLSSLADSAGARAVAVIVSGMDVTAVRQWPGLKRRAD